MAKKKLDTKKVLAAARYVREKWDRCLQGAMELQNAREVLTAAQAASETRSREYKEAESALLNLVRGEVMSSFDERGPSRVPTETYGQRVLGRR